MEDDTPPTQTQVIEDSKIESTIQAVASNNKQSPVINPKVIRPSTSQHGSPFSSYSGKQPQAQKGQVAQ